MEDDMEQRIHDLENAQASLESQARLIPGRLRSYFVVKHFDILLLPEDEIDHLWSTARGCIVRRVALRGRGLQGHYFVVKLQCCVCDLFWFRSA